jgi:DNA-directed RNA polymerase subunit RPC12/RpoP
LVRGDKALQRSEIDSHLDGAISEGAVIDRQPTIEHDDRQQITPVIDTSANPPGQRGPRTPQQRPPQAHDPQMTPQPGQGQTEQVSALLRGAQQRSAAAAAVGQANGPLTDQARLQMMPPELDHAAKQQLLKVPEQNFRQTLANYMTTQRRNQAMQIGLKPGFEAQSTFEATTTEREQEERAQGEEIIDSDDSEGDGKVTVDPLQGNSTEDTGSVMETKRTPSGHDGVDDWVPRWMRQRQLQSQDAHQDELQQHQEGGKLIDIEPDASGSEVPANSPSSRDRLAGTEEEQSQFVPLSVENEQKRAKEKNTAAEGTPVNCRHTFKVVKSDTSFVVWLCNVCHSGPHSLIYECSSCKLKTCRPCVPKASDVVTERRSTSGYDIQLGTEPVSDQKEFTDSVEVTPVVPSGKSSIQMMTTQNQQGLNQQISVDFQNEDSSESPSTNRYKCPHCSADFARQHNLKSHLLTHSEEKPYECPTCQARFRRLFALTRHTKINHVSERPHTCSKCGRKFARSDTLARHNKAGCTGRQSSLGIDENIVDGKGDEGMDGAVFTNEPDEDYKDNDDGKSSKDTVHPLQERSPEDAELIKERERILHEYELRNYNNKKAGRDDETGQITEEDKRFAEEHKHLIDEYEQKKDLKKLERSGREDESGEIAEEEKRIYEERKRLIVEYEQKKKLEKLSRESEARMEGEISKQMSRGVESPSIDAGLREAAEPNHEYERFKQQTCLPSGSIAGLDTSFNPGYPASSSSETALRQSNEERAEETAQKEREEKELEESMRKRLKQFGFKEDQINAMTDPQQQKQKQPEEEASLTSSNPFRIASPPTYPKISKEHLATETLEYYLIPYEYDAADPNYIIVLREMTHKETDILFEHTRRLRKGEAAFFESSADARGRRRVSDGASNVTIADLTSKIDNLKMGNMSKRDYILDVVDPSRLNNPGDGPNSKRMQKHPATFQCMLCPERFTRAYDLRMHLRTHTDERPIVCSICGKKFARQQDRKHHEGLHSSMPGADIRGPQTSSENSIAGGKSSEQKASNIEDQDKDAYRVYNNFRSMNEQTLKDHSAELEVLGRKLEVERSEEIAQSELELKDNRDRQEREDNGSSHKPKKKPAPRGFFAWAAGGNGRSGSAKKEKGIKDQEERLRMD